MTPTDYTRAQTAETCRKQACEAISRVACDGGTAEITLRHPVTDVLYVGTINQASALTFLAEYLDDQVARRGKRFWARLRDRARLPYAFKKLKPMPGERPRWLPLSRSYKPATGDQSEWADYEAHRDDAVTIAGDLLVARGMFTAVAPDGDMVWVYNDLPESRRNYFKRLLHVGSLEAPQLRVIDGGRDRD